MSTAFAGTSAQARIVLALDTRPSVKTSARRGYRLAPETSVGAMLVINVSALSSASITVTLAASLVVLAGIVVLRMPRLVWFSLATGAVSLTLFATPLPGAWSLLSPVGFWVFHLGVAILAGAYLLLTVKPSEMAAMLYRIRAPRWLATPLVVMVRFFPQAWDEFQAVFEAMSLRGIPVGPAAWIVHPLRTTEYLLVPMLASTSRIADDLAASALVRGLGNSARPTALEPMPLGWRDGVVGVLMAALVALMISDYSVLP